MRPTSFTLELSTGHLTLHALPYRQEQSGLSDLLSFVSACGEWLLEGQVPEDLTAYRDAITRIVRWSARTPDLPPMTDGELIEAAVIIFELTRVDSVGKLLALHLTLTEQMLQSQREALTSTLN